MSSSLNAEEFFRALHSESGLPNVYAAEGFVRKTKEEGVIEFSPSSAHCLFWLKIPVRMIDKVQPLGKRQCLDHLHDYAIIYFKTPESPEALVFAELLHHQTTAATAAAMTPTTEPLAESMGQMMDVTSAARVDCVVVRVFSFVSGQQIASGRFTQPDLVNKVRNFLRSWGAQPYGYNRSVISGC